MIRVEPRMGRVSARRSQLLPAGVPAGVSAAPRPFLAASRLAWRSPAHGRIDLLRYAPRVDRVRVALGSRGGTAAGTPAALGLAASPAARPHLRHVPIIAWPRRSRRAVATDRANFQCRMEEPLQAWTDFALHFLFFMWGASFAMDLAFSAALPTPSHGFR